MGGGNSPQPALFTQPLILFCPPGQVQFDAKCYERLVRGEKLEENVCDKAHVFAHASAWSDEMLSKVPKESVLRADGTELTIEAWKREIAAKYL